MKFSGCDLHKQTITLRRRTPTGYRRPRNRNLHRKSVHNCDYTRPPHPKTKCRGSLRPSLSRNVYVGRPRRESEMSPHFLGTRSVAPYAPAYSFYLAGWDPSEAFGAFADREGRIILAGCSDYPGEHRASDD
jgi:hypothetical protein